MSSSSTRAPSTAATAPRSRCSFLGSLNASGIFLDVVKHEATATPFVLRSNLIVTRLHSRLLHTPVRSCSNPFASTSEDALAELTTPSARVRSRDPHRRRPGRGKPDRREVRLRARGPAAARRVRRCGRRSRPGALARPHAPRRAHGRRAPASCFVRAEGAELDWRAPAAPLTRPARGARARDDDAREHGARCDAP
jgi:hypothetical protein